MKPLNCKLVGTILLRVLQYRLKIFASAADPCGTLYLGLISFGKEVLISTLNDLGWRYSLNHCRVVHLETVTSSISYVIMIKTCVDIKQFSCIR